MKKIHHVVDVDANAPDVWRAITDRDRLTAWWSTELTTGQAAVGEKLDWTFAGDFNPVMEITVLDPEHELQWRCIGGHDPWQDSAFRFELAPLDKSRTRLRFSQDYAVELSDDAYGTYNFNWGYYLESLRALCSSGAGHPFEPSEN